MPRTSVALALLATVAVVLAAPLIGEARSQLRSALGLHFSPVVGAFVLGLVCVVVVAGLARVRRTARSWQYGLIAAALFSAAAYILATGSADPAILVVEAFHFVQYGFITAVFYRAWRHRADVSAVVLPFLAAFIAGIVEEAYQWWLPARVGELRDVALNGVAIGCAVSTCCALAPPRPWQKRSPGSTLLIRRGLALTMLSLAAFIHLVHLGVVIDDGMSRFESRFTRSDLQAAASLREQRWREAPPIVRPPRFSREDQYMTEGLQHVQARNEAWDAKDLGRAAGENTILERYFSPVLDTPSYVSKSGHRWSSAHRAAASEAVKLGGADFTSEPYPYPIFLWSPWAVWGVAIAMAGALAYRGRRTF